MHTARRYTITAAALLTALLALPAGAQNSAAPPGLDPADCSNGTYVAEPAANPGLVADCRALVIIRNRWTRLPLADLPTNSPLLTWGTGANTRITTWPRIGITGQRVTTLNLSDIELPRHSIESSGLIPAELGQLTNLRHLHLEDNELTGTIPAELGRLTNLRRLYLDGNKYIGSIPAELGQLTNLWILDLNGNQLTGSIPAELGQLTNLRHLQLNGNELTGTIPAELGQLTNLTELYLDGNQLTGTIPAELGQLTNLSLLTLGENQLTGTIPAELEQQLTSQITGLGCPVLFTGSFCDDDNSGHESSIETITGWGITQGCDHHGYPRYCPRNSITRRQMAAFLHRAVTHRTGTEPAAPAAPAVLTDVEEWSSSLAYIQWAVAAGVMQAPEGVFNPGGTVTRADMAEMMAAAFDHITPPPAASGIFTDMAGQPDAVIRAAEALRTAGVTAGCSAAPLRYCPDQPVTRSQMASFFARALS